ncbi:uncharacterized protein LOC101859925 [Aplysia californica]|uniref:Delta-like protein n=1 Tax=Aplysia californica TaxID=6500 RepID=A0ABM0ZXG9_APLCA|nr:uncharacterized protein LOC101859925 [Aplysia californica]
MDLLFIKMPVKTVLVFMYFVCGIFLLATFAPKAEGTVTVFVELENYYNPGNVQFDDSCCDGERRGNNCTGFCQYSLMLCLAKSRNEDPCTLAGLSIGFLDSKEERFTFPDTFIDGFTNPVPLNLETWPGSIVVSVYLFDQDTNKQQVIDLLQVSYQQTQPIQGRAQTQQDFDHFDLTGTRALRPSSLSLSVAARCDRFFYTDTCSVFCVPSDDCNGHYTCNMTTGEKICRDGWSGQGCNIRTSADTGCSAADNCNSNGACVVYGNSTESFYCCCDPGYTGDDCGTDINECETTTCQNGGTCVQEAPPNVRCDCPQRYKGDRCQESKTCADDPCQNGGQCVPVKTTFETFACVCDESRFTGDTCDSPVTSTLTPTTSPSSQSTTPTVPPRQCYGRYFGQNCTTYCKPADDCSGHYTCDAATGARVCLPGWTQESDCKVRETPDTSCGCQNGGECFEGSCCCVGDFVGPFCEQPAQICQTKPCQNGGTCFEDLTGARCSCKEGFTGERCETMLTPNRNCDENYYGVDCGTFCQERDDCSLGQNTCNEITGKIECRFGWTGPLCNVRDLNARHSDPCPRSVCRNGALCSNDTCCCLPGYTGTLCHVEILECETKPCLNGGQCEDLIGAYSCSCPPEFTGLNCEVELNPRSQTPEVTTPIPSTDPCYGVVCENGGTCIQNGTNEYMCLCQGRYTGARCQRYILPVAANPNCPSNFYGPDCSQPCYEQDNCYSHYLCDHVTGIPICKSGWGGGTCDEKILPPSIDPECPSTSGCLHGGTCFNNSCCCTFGYQGNRCERQQLPCDSRPCGEFGTCVDLPRSYQCLCSVGYTGPKCDVILDVDSDQGLVTSSISSPPLEVFSTSASSQTALPMTASPTVAPSDDVQTSSASLFLLSSSSSAIIQSPEQSAATPLPSFETSPASSAGIVATVYGIPYASESSNTLSPTLASSQDLSLSVTSSSYVEVTPSASISDIVPSPTTLPTSDLASSSMEESNGTAPIPCGTFFCYNGGSCFYSGAGFSCLCPRQNMDYFCRNLPQSSLPASESPFTSMINPSSTVDSYTVMESSQVLQTDCGAFQCYNGGYCSYIATGVVCQCPREGMGYFCENNATVEFPNSDILFSSSSLSVGPASSVAPTSSMSPGTSAPAVSQVPSISSSSLSESPVYSISPSSTVDSSSEVESSSYLPPAPCGSFMCYNGGVCMTQSGRLYCFCPQEGMGPYCERPLQSRLESSSISDQLSTSAISPSSTILDSSLSIESSPVIEPSSVVESSARVESSSQVAAAAVACGAFFCYNGGVCTTTINGLICTCPRLGMGYFCENDDTLTTAFSDILQTSPVSVLSATDMSTSSPVQSSSVLQSSSIIESTQIPPVSCGLFNCYNGGSCPPSVLDSECICPRSGMGPFCQMADPSPASSSIDFSTSTEILSDFSSVFQTQSDVILSTPVDVTSSSPSELFTSSMDFSAITPSSSLSSYAVADASPVPCGSFYCYNGGSCYFTSIGYICQCPTAGMDPYCRGTNPLSSLDSGASTGPSSATPELSKAFFASSSFEFSSTIESSELSTASSLSPSPSVGPSDFPINTDAPPVSCGDRLCYNGGFCYYTSLGWICRCPTDGMGIYCNDTSSHSLSDSVIATDYIASTSGAGMLPVTTSYVLSGDVSATVSNEFQTSSLSLYPSSGTLDSSSVMFNTASVAVLVNIDGSSVFSSISPQSSGYSTDTLQTSAAAGIPPVVIGGLTSSSSFYPVAESSTADQVASSNVDAMMTPYSTQNLPPASSSLAPPSFSESPEESSVLSSSIESSTPGFIIPVFVDSSSEIQAASSPVVLSLSLEESSAFSSSLESSTAGVFIPVLVDSTSEIQATSSTVELSSSASSVDSFSEVTSSNILSSSSSLVTPLQPASSLLVGSSAGIDISPSSMAISSSVESSSAIMASEYSSSQVPAASQTPNLPPSSAIMSNTVLPTTDSSSIASVIPGESSSIASVSLGESSSIASVSLGESSSIAASSVVDSSSGMSSSSSVVVVTSPQPTVTPTRSVPKPISITGSVFISNPVNISDYSKLMAVVKDGLNVTNPNMTCCIQVLVDQDHVYVDNKGNQLLRLEYALTPTPRDPSQPSSTEEEVLNQIDDNLKAAPELSSNKVYRGPLYGPNEVFQSFLIGQVQEEMYGRIEDVIDRAWSAKNPDCGCTYASRVFFSHRYVGRYGMRLSRISYIVFKDGVVQSIPSTEKPLDKELNTAFQGESSLYGLYLPTDTRSYSQHFTLTTNQTVSLTAPEGIAITDFVTSSWKQYFYAQGQCSTCNIYMTFLRPEPQYTNDGGSVSNLDYFITLNGVRIRPNEVSGPAQFTGVEQCNGACQHLPAMHFYTYGYAPYYKIKSVVDDVFEQDGGIILDRQMFQDQSGRLVTKILYRPTKFGQQPVLDSYGAINNSLNSQDLSMPAVGLPLRRVYQAVIDGRVTNESLARVQGALRKAWVQTNTGITEDDIFVRLTNVDAQSSLQPDGSPVSVVQYTVSIARADSSLTIAEPPSLTTLERILNASGVVEAPPCNCDVRKKIYLTTEGFLNVTNSSQIEAVQTAIAKSWKESNPDFQGMVVATIQAISPNETEEGEGKSSQQRNIIVTLDLSGGPEGLTDRDLARPDNDVIATNFKNNGLDLSVVDPEVTPKNDEDDDDFPWYIPVAIILCLLFIIIVIIVICCIWRDYKRKDSKEIDNNPEDFVGDNYDREHFTMEPVAFENAAFQGMEGQRSAVYEVNPDPDAQKAESF